MWSRMRMPAVVFALATLESLAAHVYTEPEQALAEEFPECTIRREAHYLSREQASALQEQLSADPGRFHTFYVAERAGQVIGYGIFDTHRVRTKNETLLVTLMPDGALRRITMISFFEPEDYLAPQRWLDLFSGRGREDALRPGVDLPIMSGATLTSQAVAASARRAIALHRVYFSGP